METFKQSRPEPTGLTDFPGRGWAMGTLRKVVGEDWNVLLSAIESGQQTQEIIALVWRYYVLNWINSHQSCPSVGAPDTCFCCLLGGLECLNGALQREEDWVATTLSSHSAHWWLTTSVRSLETRMSSTTVSNGYQQATVNAIAETCKVVRTPSWPPGVGLTPGFSRSGKWRQGSFPDTYLVS